MFETVHFRKEKETYLDETILVFSALKMLKKLMECK